MVVVINERLLSVGRDFPGVAAIAQDGARHRQRNRPKRLLGRAVADGDERLIVITLHVGLDPQHATRADELAGEVQRHQPRQPGGVAGVRLDQLPLSIITQSFDRRGLQANARRGGRVIGLRKGVFDPSRQADHQSIGRPITAQPGAKIEDDSVFLGIADPGGELAKAVDGPPVPVAQRFGDVTPLQIGGALGLDGRSPCQHQPGGPRPFRSEPLVERRGDAGWPVDHVQQKLIDICNLVHGLGDREPKDAVGCLELVGCDRHRLVAIGLAVDPRRDQVAHAATAQEVADANIAAAVPREQDGAASGLAVVLGEIDLLIGNLVELALHHTVGPAQVNQIDLLSVPQAQNDRGNRLAQPRLLRGMVKRNVDPLPFERQPGSDSV